MIHRGFALFRPRLHISAGKFCIFVKRAEADACWSCFAQLGQQQQRNESRVSLAQQKRWNASWTFQADVGHLSPKL